jgi:hypothetical protein
MTNRRIDKILGATPRPGSGILYPLPMRDLEHLDPFVFLDTGEPNGPVYPRHLCGAAPTLNSGERHLRKPHGARAPHTRKMNI